MEDIIADQDKLNLFVKDLIRQLNDPKGDLGKPYKHQHSNKLL
jgi:hypothetical protein